MPRGAVIALSIVSLIWLCGCGVVMQLATFPGPVAPARQAFSVTRTADYAAQEPVRVAAIRVVVTS